MSVRKLLVGGNWKCNGNLAFAKSFPNEVLNKLVFDTSKVDVVVAPAAIHLTTVQAGLTNKNVMVAAQNLSLSGNGAYTGEFSVEMIKDAGIHHTLTGHSERRTLYGESD
jgi:triosephosphate isomerase